MQGNRGDNQTSLFLLAKYFKGCNNYVIGGWD